MAVETGTGGAPVAYRWRFGKAEFDEGRLQLVVDGHVVDLERKPLEVLQYLLRHAGEAVTKEELLSAVWDGRVVVEAVLTNAVGKLRRALGDETGAMIATLPRVGYRLEGRVNHQVVEYIPLGSRLSAGDSVPRRSNWRLEEALARGGDGEVWLARHAKTGQARVFKFSLDGQRLTGLKREVTVARLLEQALGERREFVKLIDWDFEQAPYFIEFEHGGTGLDRWQDDAGHGIDAMPLAIRLALFCEAADAVAEAHGVGVLHKDLKPANLLLAGEPGALHLRVADFGSSRVFELGVLEGLGITRLGLTQTQALSSDSGTPLYLAPEVVAGQAPSVRSDVYALGVTLYQMVVGDFRRPLAPGWEADIDDPLLREDIADAANGDATKRLDSAALLAARIRDLSGRRERKALEEAVRERIAQGEAKLARVRARRPWVIAAMTALVAGLAATGWLLERSITAERTADAQRERAERQAARAETVVHYLSNDLIRSLTPEGSGYENDPTIKEMVEYASLSVDDSFPDDPATRGNLHAAIGASWAALSDVDRSVEHYRKACKDYTAAFGETDDLTLQTKYDLVRQLAKVSAFDEAHATLADTDRIAGQRLNEDGWLALWAVWTRGELLYQELKLDDAELALQRALVLQGKVAPDRQVIASNIRMSLIDVWQRQGKFTDVIALLREVLADPALVSEEARNSYRHVLAKVLRMQNKQPGALEEALAMAEAAAESTARMQGADAQAALQRRAEVAAIHSRSGNCEKAVEIYREVWAAGVRRHGFKKRALLVNGLNLATTELRCGERQAGVQLQLQVLDALEANFPHDAFIDSTRYNMVLRLIDEKQYRDASGVLEHIDASKMAAAMSSPAAAHWVEVQRGRIQMGLGDKARGRRTIAAALDEMVRMGIDPNAPGIVKAREFLKG